ncbi:response regulator [Reichenbachiella sp.]|uniref:response regulator n=1 Tax=Reichenbachiella sp. TaxID=2184521 RepID=UPI003BB1B255
MNFPNRYITYLIAYTIVGFFYLPAWGQNQYEADSLIQLLSSDNNFSDSAICRIQNDIAFNSAQPKDKIFYAEKTAELAKKIGDEHMLALANRYMGGAYKNLGNLTKAIECYIEATHHYSNIGLELGVGVVYLDLGGVYDMQGNFDLSKYYHKKSIAILKAENDLVRMASALLNLGELYRENNLYDSATIYYVESEAMFNQAGHKTGQAIAKGNTGMVLSKLNQLELAESKILSAIAILNEFKNLAPVAEYQLTLAEIYSKKYNYKIARQWADSALAISTAFGLKGIIRDASLILSDLYVKQADFENAFQYQSQYIAYRDSINNEETIRKMADLRTDFEVSNKQIEVDLLSEKNRNANLMLYGALIGLLLVIGVAFVIYRALVANKKLSEINRQQAERLQQLDAAKSRFFANISHDLRSPLTLITGGINQVLENKEVFLTRKAEQQLKTAHINSERIIHMTGEINELIQLEEGKLTLHKAHVDMDQMLALFEQMFRVTADHQGIEWSYTKSPDLDQAIVHIDPHQFEKVLFNLITNALKHTKQGDKISMHLSGNGQNLQLSIKDTGEGIPPEKLPHIFERYFQAPDKDYKVQEGFGIGLALVQEIVHQHDASIEVESKFGRGSTFLVTIPYQTSNAEELYQLTDLSYSDEKQALYRDIDNQLAGSRSMLPLGSSPKKEDQEKATILVVEDHPEVRAYITDVIEVNYKVLLAPNGLKALRVLENETIDLIITDLMMPWLDGFELLERLKEDEKFRKIPVLVLSARTSEEDKTKVLSQGVNDFLCKPFKPQELLLRVENLLTMKATWNNTSPNALLINNTETLADVERALLKKVEQLIYDKIDDPHLSIGYLADQIAMSERNFYRMIKRLTDSTPLELVKELRLQLAHKILKEKTVSTSSEVAKQIGINNVTHFNAQFKKRFGKSPKDLF